MNRDRISTVLVVILGIVVVATAANAIGTAKSGGDSTDGDLGMGGGDGKVAGTGNRLGTDVEMGGQFGTSSTLTALFRTVVTIISIVLTVLFIAYLLVVVIQRDFAEIRSLLAVILGISLTCVVLYFALASFTDIAHPIQTGDGGGGLLGPGSGRSAVEGTTGADEGSSVPFSQLILVGVFAVTVLVVLYLATRNALSGGSAAGPVEASTADADRLAPGESPSEQALEVEDVPPSNGVYRAWRELAKAVGPAEPTTTPGEIERLAVDAGMGSHPVSELTALFREVRYNGVSPTDDRERRAASALDAIEGGGPDVIEGGGSDGVEGSGFDGIDGGGSDA